MAGPPRRTVSVGRLLATLVLIGVVLVGVTGLWFGMDRLFGEPPAGPGSPVTVTVPPGATASDIAVILEGAAVVPSAAAFTDRLVADGLGGAFLPGTYTFRTNEEYRLIVNQLNAGPADAPASQRLVIPEGFALWDIEAEVGKVGIGAETYAEALKGYEPPAGFLAPGEQAASLEGFLFPATYDVGAPGDADALIQEQLGAFAANVASVDMSYAESRGLTPYDVLKIASLIEREVVAPQERRIVSAIIYNRLAAGMPVGMESGIQYAQGSWGILTREDLEIDSPYNLWNRPGLPPTPICNPGLAAIKAAANPADVNYLFMYAIKDDPQQRHYFTDDYDDFMRYQRENPYW
jgi:UPF0755 protein